MSEYKKDDLVRCWPGGIGNRNYIATVISEGVVEFGGTDCVRVRQPNGGSDYMAVTHAEVVGRVEGRTAYVQTFKDALEVSTLELDDVVIENREESLKAKKIIKGFRSVQL
jgi:hypothetical protein